MSKMVVDRSCLAAAVVANKLVVMAHWTETKSQVPKTTKERMGVIAHISLMVAIATINSNHRENLPIKPPIISPLIMQASPMQEWQASQLIPSSLVRAKILAITTKFLFSLI